MAVTRMKLIRLIILVLLWTPLLPFIVPALVVSWWIDARRETPLCDEP